MARESSWLREEHAAEATAVMQLRVADSRDSERQRAGGQSALSARTAPCQGVVDERTVGGARRRAEREGDERRRQQAERAAAGAELADGAADGPNQAAGAGQRLARKGGEPHVGHVLQGRPAWRGRCVSPAWRGRRVHELEAGLRCR